MAGHSSIRVGLVAAAIAACGLESVAGVEYPVSSAAEIQRITNRLLPGDVIVLADAIWRNQELVLRGRGTESQPITFRANAPGKVIITGQSSIEIEGEHIVVSGLCLQGGEAAKEGVVIRGRHCRFTEGAVVDSSYKFYVRLFGTEHRVDHCYFAGKTTESPTLQIEVESNPNRHRIDYNHFGPRPPLGRNGGETIRIGYSHQSMLSSRTLIEANLFDRCDGELEIISNKSCDNIYRANTFLECAGMFTLRHGNRCRVEGNFFFGRQKRGSGGIRVIGEDHVIVNNYIDGVMQGGFWVTAGIPNSPLVGYFQAKNCVIAFNTIVNSRGPCIDVAAGLGSSGRTLIPEGIMVANNLFARMLGEPLVKGTETKGYQWLGNLADISGGKGDHIPAADLGLVRGDDHLLRPRPESPARGSALGTFDAVSTDIDGQTRTEKKDIGCDQLSLAPVVNRPLTVANVGPAWRRPTASTSQLPLDAGTRSSAD